MTDFLGRLIARTAAAMPTIEPLIRPSEAMGVTPAAAGADAVFPAQPDAAPAAATAPFPERAGTAGNLMPGGAPGPDVREGASRHLAPAGTAMKPLVPPGASSAAEGTPVRPETPAPQAMVTVPVDGRRSPRGGRRKSAGVVAPAAARSAAPPVAAEPETIGDSSGPRTMPETAYGEEADGILERRGIRVSRLVSARPARERAGAMPPATGREGWAAPMQRDLAGERQHGIGTRAAPVEWPPAPSESGYGDGAPRQSPGVAASVLRTGEATAATVVPTSARRAPEEPAVRLPEGGPPVWRREGPPALEAAPPPPSIHVTIGRIEVRAMPSPVPGTPVPAPRRTEQILSLDDYLKGRSEGNR